MKENEYIDQLRDIKTIMDRSTRFLSLSGLSGVMAGVYALAGAFLANLIINNHLKVRSGKLIEICLIAAIVLIFSIVTAFVFSKAKSRKTGEKLWSSSSKRLFINLSIPLITGGVFGVHLLQHYLYGLIPPVMLIFYGLALLQASKYTLETIRSLGILFIILGLINCWFIGYGLYFWAMGFGVLHIIYGTYMHFTHDRKSAE